MGGEDSPEKDNSNPLQYSCLEKSMDRRAWGGYSPGDCIELDMTEKLSAHAHTHTYTHTHMNISESLCCIPETRDINYTSIKKKLKRKKTAINNP